LASSAKFIGTLLKAFTGPDRLIAMRITVDKDKIEEVLTRRRTDSWLSFPPRGTAPTDKISILGVFKYVWIAPGLFFFFVTLLFVVLSFVITADLSMRLYQHIRLDYIYKITRNVLRDAFPALILSLLIMFVFNVAIHLPIRWAWNRRANRLNQIGNPSVPAPVTLPGVWPPPPTVSVSSDHEPRI
jgi:ABC-type Fe3+ transport system permease subunit